MPRRSLAVRAAARNSKENALFDWITQTRNRFEALPRARRELLLFGAALLFGLLIVPPLIWLVGDAVLGEYTNGGLLALFGDYFVALAHGSLIFWIVALGPYLLFVLLRLMVLVFRRQPD